MYKKILITGLLLLLACTTVYGNQGLYPGTDITRLQFEMDGNPIIYSNYPETLVDAPGNKNLIGEVDGVFYGIGKHYNKAIIEPEKIYTAEIYNGRLSEDLKPYIFGIAFINESDKDISINVSKSGQQSSQGVGIVQMAFQTQYQFVRSDLYPPQSTGMNSIPRKIQLKAQESKIVLFEEITNQKDYANGKIQFTASDEVILIEFYMLADYLKENLNKEGLSLSQTVLDQKDLSEMLLEISRDENRIEKLEEQPRYYSTTTAILQYDTRKATVSASVGTRFYLSSAGHIQGIRDLNIDEYEPLKETDIGGFPANGVRIHDGNYSIYYEIELTEAVGKNIKITPYKQDGVSISSGVLLYTDAYGWQLPTPYADYWIMPVPEDGKFTFMLPGSVYGDILFEIIEPSIDDSPFLVYLDPSYSAWAESIISESVAIGLVPWELQGNYKGNLNRAEFCRFALHLYIMAKGEAMEDIIISLGDSFEADNFDDIDDPLVDLAFNLGIAKGTGNRAFMPRRYITRQEAAVMLENVAVLLGVEINLEKPYEYADHAGIANWAQESVYKLRAINVLQGTGDNYFSPAGLFTRQEGITAMRAIYNVLPED